MPTVLEYIGAESVGSRFLFCLINQANYFVDWTCTDLRMSLRVTKVVADHGFEFSG